MPCAAVPFVRQCVRARMHLRDGPKVHLKAAALDAVEAAERDLRTQLTALRMEHSQVLRRCG
jgi:hypothetical protein